MDQSLLVAVNPVLAERLWHAFEGAELDVRLILLGKFEEFSEERLVLASPSFDSQSSHFNYMEFGRILRRNAADFNPPFLLLVKMSDGMVQDLHRRFGEVNRPYGMHLRNVSLGDRFLEDGYLFRLVGISDR